MGRVVFAMLAAVAIAALLAPVCVEAAPKLMGPNVTFETGTFDFSCDVDSKKVNASCKIQDPTAVQGGGKGLSVTLAGVPKDADAVKIKSGEWDLKAGKPYTFTFWGFNPKPPAPVEAVVEDASSGKAVGGANFTLIADWVQKAVNFTPSADGTYRLVLKGLGKNMSIPLGTNNKYMFDSFAVYDGVFDPEEYEEPPMVAKPDGDSALRLPPPVEIDEEGNIKSLPVSMLPTSKPSKSTAGSMVLSDDGSEGLVSGSSSSKSKGDKDDKDGDDKKSSDKDD